MLLKLTQLSHPSGAESAKLPNAWQRLELREVCLQDRRIVEPASAEATSLTYLGLEHIESNTGRVLRTTAKPASEEGRSTTFAFDERHILYGKLRPYLNKVALPECQGRCTTELIPLLPRPEIVTREYLANLLRSGVVVAAAMQGKTGSRMPRADMDSLMALRFPIPPLADQRRLPHGCTTSLTQWPKPAPLSRHNSTRPNRSGSPTYAPFLKIKRPTPGQKKRLAELLAQPLRTGLSKSNNGPPTSRCLTSLRSTMASSTFRSLNQFR